MKYIYIMLTISLLYSCNNEIKDLPVINQKELVINALLNTNSQENDIYIFQTGNNSITPVKNGIIKIYKNNKLCETIDNCSKRTENNDIQNIQEYYYRSKLNYKTGDTVKIEVKTSDGIYNAESETIIDEPLFIESVDTIHISKNNKYNSYDAIRLKINIKCNPTNATKYYRIQTKQECKYITKDEKEKKDSIINYILWGCDYQYDVALTNGKPGSNDIDDDIEIIPRIENNNKIFTNFFFDKNCYNMTVDLYDNNFYYDSIKYSSNNTTIQLYSISQNEYRYLSSLNAYNKDNASNILISPVIFPNNIKGGIGIFAIENLTEYKIKLL